MTERAMRVMLVGSINFPSNPIFAEALDGLAGDNRAWRTSWTTRRSSGVATVGLGIRHPAGLSLGHDGAMLQVAAPMIEDRPRGVGRRES